MWWKIFSMQRATSQRRKRLWKRLMALKPIAKSKSSKEKIQSIYEIFSHTGSINRTCFSRFFFVITFLGIYSLQLIAHLSNLLTEQFIELGVTCQIQQKRFWKNIKIFPLSKNSPPNYTMITKNIKLNTVRIKPVVPVRYIKPEYSPMWIYWFLLDLEMISFLVPLYSFGPYIYNSLEETQALRKSIWLPFTPYYLKNFMAILIDGKISESNDQSVFSKQLK